MDTSQNSSSQRLMHSKKLFFVLLIVIVVLIVIAVIFGALLKKAIPGGASDYAAVYLVTGDIYYGKLCWFPVPHLKDVWYLQRGVDEQNQQELAIAPLDTVFWSPINKLYLNPKQVVWWTYLKKDSVLVEGFTTSGTRGTVPAGGAGAATPPQSGFQGPGAPPPGQE